MVPSNPSVLGLCCISLVMKGRDPRFHFRTMTFKQYRNLGREKALRALSSRILHNLILTRKIVQFCGESGILHYRLSSSLFPLLTHPEASLTVGDLPDSEDILKTLKRIGRTAKKHKVSLSVHPSQYNVLASENNATRDKTLTELNFVGWVLDRIGLPRNWEAPINIHVNRKGNPENIGSLFLDSVSRLEDSARHRLVVENEDKGCWTPQTLHRFISYPGDIPITFDFLHYKCNPDPGVSERAAFDLCFSTWKDFTPVFHYTESLNFNKPRAHCEYCKDFPPDHGKPYICEIEAKAKDFAVLRLILKKTASKAQLQRGR